MLRQLCPLCPTSSSQTSWSRSWTQSSRKKARKMLHFVVINYKMVLISRKKRTKLWTNPAKNCVVQHNLFEITIINMKNIETFANLWTGLGNFVSHLSTTGEVFKKERFDFRLFLSREKMAVCQRPWRILSVCIKINSPVGTEEHQVQVGSVTICPFGYQANYLVSGVVYLSENSRRLSYRNFSVSRTDFLEVFPRNNPSRRVFLTLDFSRLLISRVIKTPRSKQVLRF